MRTFIYLLAIHFLIVSSFNIRHLGNSIDNPETRHQEKSIDPIDNSNYEIHHLKLQRLLHELEEELREEVIERNEVVREQPKQHKKTLDGEIAVSINENGIKYVKHQLMSAIRHDVVRHPPMSMKTAYLGMELSINSVQIIHFHPPALEFEYDNNVLKIVATGGQAKLLGLYSAVYKTTREGQLAATVKDLHLELEVNLKGGNITESDIACSHSIGIVDVVLQPAMPTQITDQLRDTIIRQLGYQICPTVSEYVRKMNKMTRSLALLTKPTEKLSETGSDVSMDIMSSEANSNDVSISFDRHKHHTISTVTLPEQNSKMASLVVSEEYINDYLHDWTTSNDVTFQLHRIPEVKSALALSCAGSTDCLGNYVHLNKALDHTAQLESKIVGTPYIEVEESGAKVFLTLANKLSYNEEGDNVVEYLRYRTSLVLRIKEIRLHPTTKHDLYRWEAKFELENISNSDFESSEEQLIMLGRQLDFMFVHHKHAVEDLISTYLIGTVPLRLNSHIHLSENHVTFQQGQMTLLADFKINRRLFPFFTFMKQ